MERTTEARYERAVKRCGGFSQLEDGWLDGEGIVITREVIKRGDSLLAALYDIQVAPPRVYPTPDGGIQFEWHNDLEIEISADTSIEVRCVLSGEPAIHTNTVGSAVDAIKVLMLAATHS